MEKYCSCCGNEIKEANNNYLKLIAFANKNIIDRIKNFIFGELFYKKLTDRFDYKLQNVNQEIYNFCSQSCAIKSLNDFTDKKIIADIIDNTAIPFQRATSPLFDLEMSFKYINDIYDQINRQKVYNKDTKMKVDNSRLELGEI